MDQPPSSPPARSHHGRSFSFRSDKSGGSGKKNDPLVESPREKERRDQIWKNSSKANPNAAMNEAQPGEINMLEKPTIEPLRNYEHKDTKGNVITDPDLSNPTRPRMERPLDTIRSFERAIDTGYRRKTGVQGAENFNPSNQYGSRRNSYFDGYDSNAPVRPSQGPPAGYYGSYGQPQRMRYGPRMQSDPSGMRGNGFYPQHNYHQSYDTVGTGMTYNSDSTGPWANSTDPSSENSSLDRMNATSNPYHGQQDTYQHYDTTQDPIMEDQVAASYGPSYRQDHTAYAVSPPQPPPAERRPIQLNSANPTPLVPRSGNLPSTPRAAPEKRQSWLKRRFSKQA